MSNGTSTEMCSVEAEEAIIGKGEDKDGEDSAGSELVAQDLGLLLRPPRLEDAGLEDCALPPESIQEAFSIAAKSLNSRFASYYTSEDDEDERGVECGPFNAWVDFRPNGFPEEVPTGSEGASGGGAMGAGGGFPEEKALGSYVSLGEVVPGSGHGVGVPVNGGRGTGTGTRGEQTQQSAGSDDFIDTLRTGS